MLNELKSNSDRISLLTGFGRVCHGIQDLTKTQFRIQESLTREKAQMWDWERKRNSEW